MVFCDTGIVLLQRSLRENDRIVTIYTAAHGKTEVSFRGVNLSRAKLRAMSEPLTWGDYRFYLRPGSNFPVCTGGQTLSVFPNIRSDIERICLAYHFVNLLIKLTPSGQPNAEKYELLLSALMELDTGRFSKWMRTAFTLRLMEITGFGFQKTAVGIDDRIWTLLHNGDWNQVHDLNENDVIFKHINDLVSEFLTISIGQPVKTAGLLK